MMHVCPRRTSTSFSGAWLRSRRVTTSKTAAVCFAAKQTADRAISKHCFTTAKSTPTLQRRSACSAKHSACITTAALGFGKPSESTTTPGRRLSSNDLSHDLANLFYSVRTPAPSHEGSRTTRANSALASRFGCRTTSDRTANYRQRTRQNYDAPNAPLVQRLERRPFKA
jgi:hypothetical protein